MKASHMRLVNELRDLGLVDEIDFKLDYSPEAHEWIFNWGQREAKERESSRNWALSDGRYLTRVHLTSPREYMTRFDDCLVRLSFNDGSTAVIEIVPQSNNARVKMKDRTAGRTVTFISNMNRAIDQVERTDRFMEAVLTWLNDELTKA